MNSWLRWVLSESLVICGAGILAGVPLAVACARLMRSMLFGLGPNNALSFAAALLGIEAVAVGASLIPGHRAASVDPLVALRYE